MSDHCCDPLYKLRHSLAHVLAQAVLEIRPDSKLAFGPPIDDGCYYDFLFSTPLTPEDFPDIEKRMRKIIAARQPFSVELRDQKSAQEFLGQTNQNFKIEYCNELFTRGETQLSFYRNGTFEDMCEGPHLEHTGQIPPDCFKLDTLAGAYWRGNEKNPQLTRIYCLAFENKQKLAEFVKNRELAKERDHRKLGRELELYVISDLIGPGLPLWTPNGTAIKEALETYAKEVEMRHGYQRVSTPHIAREETYLTSGHLPYYKDVMFPPMHVEGESDYYLKSMNCPHHFEIYSYRPRSYRELPLRLAEYAMVYRFEPSGSLSGLLRVRSIDQNDAHIFCTPDQVKSEMKDTFNMTLDYYKLFRLQDVKFRFSTHNPENKDKYVDNPEMWAFSENVVKEVLEELQVPYFLGFGEAAFYGPKIDFQAKTGLGREESLGTSQMDFSNPIRFKLRYVGEDGKEHQPYIVHRAPLGSHERTIAFLIEHFGGAFPTWMAPMQVRLIPVGEMAFQYAKELEALLRSKLIRVESDLSDNSFNKKIREAVTQKIPNMAIIGGKEVESQSVTLRRYCVKEQVQFGKDAFVDYLLRLNSMRVMDNFADVAVG